MYPELSKTRSANAWYPASDGWPSFCAHNRVRYWAVTSKGIYFIDFNVANDAPRPVKFFNFQTRQIRQIGAVEKGVSWDRTKGLTVSPGSRWLLYPSFESTEAHLMLVDNFR